MKRGSKIETTLNFEKFYHPLEFLRQKKNKKITPTFYYDTTPPLPPTLPDPLIIQKSKMKNPRT